MRRVPMIATAAAAAAAALIIPPATGSIAAATGSRAPMTYHAVRGSAHRIAHAASLSSVHVVRGAFSVRQLNRLRAFRSPAGADPAARATGALAPRVETTATPQIRPADDGSFVIHAFNGVSQLDSQTLLGPAFPVTPPDQGLCVGHDSSLAGDPKVVWEPVNLAASETTPNGTLLRPTETLATLYADPFFVGDVRCLYDASTRTFIFTEIGFPVATGPAPDFNNTTADVTVMNAHGVANYQFDTSLGGPSAGDCFGDQPKVGFDNNAVVISTDEFCNPTESNFEGAIALVISKSQLVHEDATVNDAVLGPVSLAGDPVTGLDPAIDSGLGHEYLVNSVPFLADGSNNPVGNTLGLWTLRNTRSVTTGVGTPTLTSAVLASEPYGFPVPATSTGDGSSFSAPPFTITKETALNPDDSRISGPVVVTDEGDGVRLWTTLDAAVTPNGDSAVRDAAAWFEIDPASQRVVHQGYVTAGGAYLVYPAIDVREDGPASVVFTITSSTINPSAAFARIGSNKITIVGAGAAAHQSFSDSPPFNNSRWGDYSFSAPDPDNGGLWFATEYIPPAASQAVDDNWGTEVFEVNGH